MKQSIWYADWLPFAVLQVADVVTTGIGFTLGAVEINPLGFTPAVVFFKAVYTVVISRIIQSGFHPLLRQMVTTLFGIAVIWNCLMILQYLVRSMF